MKAGTYFAAATAALIVISYLVLQLGFDSPGDPRALRTSAMVAIAVQLVSFAIARRMPLRNMMLGWESARCFGFSFSLSTLCSLFPRLACRAGLPWFRS